MHIYKQFHKDLEGVSLVRLPFTLLRHAHTNTDKNAEG